VRRLPPLVTPPEVDRLLVQLAEVAEGKRFLLQGGDCAERFMDCAAEPIEKKLKILLQMSLVLTWGARMPTLRISRMAGQFSKPRSKDTEVVDGVEMPSFRGDNINSFDTSSRAADPARLVSGYFHSAATLNYARALLASGFADLHRASHWDLDFVQDTGHRAQYKALVDRILSAMDFMRVCGVADEVSLRTADFFMSHEGLQLDLEEALTRAGPAASEARAHGGAWLKPPAAPSAPAPDDFYNLGTHFLWIGDRTRQLDHAHVEYFRGIANPVGIKVGPSSDPEELVAVIRRLWPDPAAAPGKIVLITRMGAGAVLAKLPAILRAVQAAGLTSRPVWVCDPMHGNTRNSSNGFKTREFDDILGELKHTFAVHRECGSHLGGVHFELTGENVTECTGGPERLLEADLPLRYTTYCDPRLNYAQSMELAFLIAQFLADEREEAVAEAMAAGSGVSVRPFGAPPRTGRPLTTPTPTPPLPRCRRQISGTGAGCIAWPR